MFIHRIFNLTAHDITVIGPDNEPIAHFPAAPQSAHVAIKFGPRLVMYDGIPIKDETSYGQIDNLPAAAPNIMLIVPTVVGRAATARSRRSDLLYATEKVVAPDGRVVGYRSLTLFRRPGQQTPGSKFVCTAP